MKRRYSYLCLLVLCMISCKDNSIDFGTVEYYPDFLWSKSSVTPVKKIFDFDFSQDAKDDPNSFAEFQFVDNDGKPINTNEMQVFIDGKQLVDNKFVVKSDVSSIVLLFTFSPTVKEGNHQGYLKLINHQLDRLDSQPLTSGQKVDAFQWTLSYDKCMNPLAKALMWIGIGIIAILAVWFIVLRPIIYPRFGSIQKTFNVPGMAPLIVKMTGARMVVISSEQKKQGFWDALIKGSVVYKSHPSFISPITMRPTKGRKILVRVDSSTYRVSPNPMPGIGTATIDNIRSKMHITIN